MAVLPGKPLTVATSVMVMLLLGAICGATTPGLSNVNIGMAPGHKLLILAVQVALTLAMLATGGSLMSTLVAVSVALVLRITSV